MAEENPDSSSRRRSSLREAPELPCSLVDLLFFVVDDVVVEVVVVILVVFFLFFVLVLVVVVEVVIPVGDCQVPILSKDELAAAFRTAQRVALFKVVRIDLFVIAVRAGRHIARSSIESATSRRRGIISGSTRRRQ